jgi:hypothetical protein
MDQMTIVGPDGRDKYIITGDDVIDASAPVVNGTGPICPRWEHVFLFHSERKEAPWFTCLKCGMSMEDSLTQGEPVVS